MLHIYTVYTYTHRIASYLTSTLILCFGQFVALKFARDFIVPKLFVRCNAFSVCKAVVLELKQVLVCVHNNLLIIFMLD